MHLVGFIIRIYHDARSSECQKLCLFFPCTSKRLHGTQQNPISCPSKQNMQAVCCHSWQVRHRHILSFTNSHDLVWELEMSVWRNGTICCYSRAFRSNNLQNSNCLCILLLLLGSCLWHQSCRGSKTHPLTYWIEWYWGGDVFHKGQVARVLHYNSLPCSAKVKDARHLLAFNPPYA